MRSMPTSVFGLLLSLSGLGKAQPGALALQPQDQERATVSSNQISDLAEHGQQYR